MLKARKKQEPQQLEWAEDREKEREGHNRNELKQTIHMKDAKRTGYNWESEKKAE